ncbi:META domain-containing protein [Sphingomonas lutea]|uniref:META domain-containing protein n=1 Tax=Sphingomonas lutea TaxID=1045317 RepID=A0A7G9SFW4_9SPHN|nr:META domain-containing protein [Sphingomonas lutea]QNN66739.1 META domain-containing protein [Sphingomonas lutea]
MAAAVFRAAALALALAGCASVTADARSFEGTRWTVTKLNDRSAGGELSFSGGQVGGSFGCNRFSGPYRTAGQMLIVQTLAVTQMACASALDEGPDPMAIEGQGFAVLGQPMRMDWRSGTALRLSNAAGSLDLQIRP